MRTSMPRGNSQGPARPGDQAPPKPARLATKVRGIDRHLPGVGRLTLRTKKMSSSLRNELDGYIRRAGREGDIVALRLLKERRVSPMEFLFAARANKLALLRPSQAIKALKEEWLDKSDLRPSTKARYRQSWAIIERYLPKDATLDSITSEWWDVFVSGRAVGNATHNRDLAAITALRGWVREKKKYAVPEFAVDRKVEEPVRSGILSTAQVALVRERCRADRWPVFWTLFEAGLRQGELLNLRDYDVPQDEDLVVIRSQEGSKGRGKQRSVPISPELANCLRTIAVVNGAGRLFPYGRNTIQQWWKEICRAVGTIHGVTLHGIRATFITRALDAGVPVTEVQKLAGHSQLSTTMKYYRNPEESRIAAATARQAVGIDSALNTGTSVSSSTDPLAQSVHAP